MHSCIHLSGFCLLCGLSFGCFLYYLIFLSCVLYILCGLSFRCFIYYGPFFYCRCFCLSDGLSIIYDLSIVWNVHQMVSISGGQSIRWSFLRIHKGLLFVYQSAINASNLFLFSLKQIFVAKTHVFVCIFSLAYYSKQKIQSED